MSGFDFGPPEDLEAWARNAVDDLSKAIGRIERELSKSRKDVAQAKRYIGILDGSVPETNPFMVAWCQMESEDMNYCLSQRVSLSSVEYTEEKLARFKKRLRFLKKALKEMS